jgi:glutamate N-acetyltransferase/amino-acid N-acetyltransferase
MKIIKGTITSPQGFKANGFWAGVKRSGKPDLGLVFSQYPCTSAAMFTRNSVKAAPIQVCMKHIKEVNEISKSGHQHSQHGGARQLGPRVNNGGNF